MRSKIPPKNIFCKLRGGVKARIPSELSFWPAVSDTLSRMLFLCCTYLPLSPIFFRTTVVVLTHVSGDKGVLFTVPSQYRAAVAFLWPYCLHVFFFPAGERGIRHGRGGDGYLLDNFQFLPFCSRVVIPSHAVPPQPFPALTHQVQRFCSTLPSPKHGAFHSWFSITRRLCRATDAFGTPAVSHPTHPSQAITKYIQQHKRLHTAHEIK